jgi:lambda family phage portal protein
MIQFLKNLLRKRKGTRDYSSLAATGVNADWRIAEGSDDRDLWQSAWALTNYVRDLFKTNPIYIAYREQLWAQVFGSEGIMLRSQVKETEDRVIHTPEEERAIVEYEKRRNRVLEFLASKSGQEFKARSFLHVSGLNGSRKATVKVGEPDIFARAKIEQGWKEWSRKEFCDFRGTRNYQTQRQLRLIGAVRDGDIFIRLIKTPGVNKFGFTTHLINAEYVDRFLNRTLANGNVIRMGIEYGWNQWGLGKPVAYHFIKRQERDWQYTTRNLFGFSGNAPAVIHDRIPAEQVIHYHRAVDADATRPAPWVAATIPKARQLDQYELAEVIAARVSACKTGYLYSDVVPEGGFDVETINPATGLPVRPLQPGEVHPLPFGVKFQAVDPKHPNGNFEAFRKAMMRSYVAGMPGANYSTLSNDYEAINFSAGRLQRLDSNELYKQIQAFDIDYAETVIFENWLEMALMSGALGLPLSKLDKFNKKIFQGRRWAGVDEIKEVTAAALRVANGFSSDQRECADKGFDFEEIAFERAEAAMINESLGLKTEKTVEKPAAQAPEQKPKEESDGGDSQNAEEDDDEHDPTVFKSRW